MPCTVTMVPVGLTVTPLASEQTMEAHPVMTRYPCLASFASDRHKPPDPDHKVGRSVAIASGRRIATRDVREYPSFATWTSNHTRGTPERCRPCATPYRTVDSLRLLVSGCVPARPTARVARTLANLLSEHGPRTGRGVPVGPARNGLGDGPGPCLKTDLPRHHQRGQRG